MSAIDAHIAHLRLADEIFSSLSTSDRKAKSRRRKYVERYTAILSDAFKACIRNGLSSVFARYGEEETTMCNKGVDKAPSGVQWVEYPGKENVLFEEGD